MEDEVQGCLQNLHEATVDREHPWRLFSFATVSLEGEPVNRQVVLREVEQHSIIFYSDIRSQKIRSLRRFNRASLCFYDGHQQLQLVIKAKVRVHHLDSITKDKWEKMAKTSRLCYFMEEEPGTPLREPFWLEASKINEEQAYGYFAVVACESLEWDVLRLKREGNQRSKILFDETGVVSVTYVAP